VTGSVIQNRPIRQPDKRGFSEALKLLALTFGVAAPFIIYVSISARMIQEEYHLSKLVEQRRLLVRERERLTLQRAALLSPEVIERVAREKLGMVDEDPQEMTVGVVPEKKPEKPAEPAPAKPAKKAAVSKKAARVTAQEARVLTKGSRR
jgi:cell division protein FtsL